MTPQDKYKNLIKRLKSLFEIPVYHALQRQIESFIKEFQKNPNAIPTNLPTQVVYDVIAAMYQTGGLSGAQISKAQIEKILRQSYTVPKTINEYVLTRYYESFLLSKVVLPITQTTINEINKVLQQKTENGWGIDQTVRALRTNEITKSRATLIVRTEAMRAANMGAMVGAAGSPVAVRKMWISTQDNRTRRIPRNQYDHLDMNGVLKEFDEKFIIPSTVSIDAMDMPGDSNGSAGNVCNCRCSVAFVPIRDENGLAVPVENYKPQHGSIFRSLFLAANRQSELV